MNNNYLTLMSTYQVFCLRVFHNFVCNDLNLLMFRLQRWTGFIMLTLLCSDILRKAMVTNQSSDRPISSLLGRCWNLGIAQRLGRCPGGDRPSTECILGGELKNEQALPKFLLRAKTSAATERCPKNERCLGGRRLVAAQPPGRIG